MRSSDVKNGNTGESAATDETRRGLRRPQTLRSFMANNSRALRHRIDFSKIPATIQIPNLIEVQ